MSAASLSHSNSPPSILLLPLPFLWPGVAGPWCSGDKMSCSVCRSTSRFSLSLPASGSTVFQDLVQIVLLLTCFIASPHVTSLFNYFSSACHAIFISRMFLSARLAFGLLSIMSRSALMTVPGSRLGLKKGFSISSNSLGFLCIFGVFFTLFLSFSLSFFFFFLSVIPMQTHPYVCLTFKVVVS